VKLIDIAVDPQRRRDDLGDMAALEESIKTHGQLQPIMVEHNTYYADRWVDTYRLIHGYRRYRAFQELGYTNIRVRPVSTADDAAARYHHDTEVAVREVMHHQEPMLPSEIAALGVAIEALPASPNRPLSPEHHRQHIDINDVVAPALGMTPSYYTRLRRLWKAALRGEGELGQLAGSLLADLDVGRITPNYAFETYAAAYVEEHGKRKKRSPAESLRRRAQAKAMAAKGKNAEEIRAALGYGRIETIYRIGIEDGFVVPRPPGQQQIVAAERRARIAELAATGMGSEAIAKELGYNVRTVRDYAATDGVSFQGENRHHMGSKGAAARRAQIGILAGQGMSSEQIARQLAYGTADTVRDYAREDGVDIPGDRSGVQNRMDPLKIVDNTVSSFEGDLTALELVDPAQLRPTAEDVAYWTKSIDNTVKALRAFAKALRAADTQTEGEGPANG
jgi:ParB-like chromosome segregation protein Spo0J